MLLCMMSMVFVTAAETKFPLRPGWETSATLESKHATQAGACDKQFAYAVSNTHVARYDRKTGKLLGTGTSTNTKHLNSAFVWKGKVYCAHSTYPKQPPQSDIRVYDPSDDSLKIYHTFTNPPGSLVWCIRRPREKFWWCCFAHYGKTNAKTMLLKMDDKFQELARWTFPERVVQDWDGMSASGGIWDGETLLATHHHFQVLYRLRLPSEGKQLEFVEALTSPFPGQGIAVDPTTPRGLVGIDRPRRRIVFAIPQKKE